MPDLHPLLFEPILKEKVWGGRRLARYGKRLPAGGRIGESWEIADLSSTSASGGGGGAARSVVRNGPCAGADLHELIAAHGVELLGEAGMEPAHALDSGDGPSFPLLVKLLDASEHLSVQVHPSPAFAREHRWAHLKTESWYVLEAERTVLADGTPVEPVLFKGLREGVTPETLRACVERGDCGKDLIARPAVPGTCHTLPSGTCHALGAGVLVAEVQTPSDTTFRLYDWTREYGRPEREMHVDRALECIDFDNPGAPPGVTASRCAQTEHYVIDRVHEATRLEPDGFAVVLLLSGEALLDDGEDLLPLRPGDTSLVPATVSGRTRIRGEGFSALVVRLPG